MSGDRIEQAVQRIESALARIADAAEAVGPTQTSVSGLVVRHEALRESVSATLRDLDDLIGRIER